MAHRCYIICICVPLVFHVWSFCVPFVFHSRSIWMILLLSVYNIQWDMPWHMSHVMVYPSAYIGPGLNVPAMGPTRHPNLWICHPIPADSVTLGVVVVVVEVVAAVAASTAAPAASQPTLPKTIPCSSWALRVTQLLTIQAPGHTFTQPLYIKYMICPWSMSHGTCPMGPWIIVPGLLTITALLIT